MTEERWATEERPDSVLYAVEWTNRRLMTSRKVRLFACGNVIASSGIESNCPASTVSWSWRRRVPIEQ